MALLWMDSFDHYATADALKKYTQVIPGFQYDTSAIAAVGRRGTNGWRFSKGVGFANTLAFSKVLTPADNTVIVGMAFACLSPFAWMGIGTNPWDMNFNVLLLVRNAAQDQCWVRLNSDGTLSVLRGSTIIATTTLALPQATYVYVEIKLTIHATQGVIAIRFNGADAMTPLTLQNTGGAGNAWSELRWGWAASPSNSANFLEWDVDDLYVLDGSGAAPYNNFLGDVRVDTCVPTAPGATTGWTPLAGANWDAVNDVAPDGDTTYVSTPTVNAIDTFTFSNITPALGAGGVVHGIQHCVALKKTDAGACAVAPMIRLAGIDYPGANLSPLSVGYLYGTQVVIAKPTGGSWTEADVNAAEFGYKRTA